MKQIPNLLTLLNLVFGCLAIVVLLQNGFRLVETDDGMGFVTGQQLQFNPESIYLAPLFIALAALVDFFDGFAARLLKVSGDMGKQLDSLADVVSFGVAPSIIIYQFLRMSLAAEPDGLYASFLWLVPAFVLAAAAAYRLARFNIDEGPSHYFRGTPVPSVGLAVAAFPLVYWHAASDTTIRLLTNKWFWYALTLVLSWLMVSSLPIMSNKPRAWRMPYLLPHALVLVVAIISLPLLGWWCVPVTFATFVLASLLFKKQIV